MRNVKTDARKPKLLATMMVAGLAGACSSDVSRFGSDPFGNPFQSRTSDPASTNSINRSRAPTTSQQAYQPMPVAGSATTQALPPQSLPTATRPLLNAKAPDPRAPAYTGSVASSSYPPLAPVAHQPAVVGASNGWTASGGTPVMLQPGENINTLSARYGVPASAIMATNGLSNVNHAQPGQQVIIPAYNPANVGRTASATPAPTASVIQRLPPATKAAAAPIPPKPVQPIAAPPVARVATTARQVVPAAESDAEKRAAAKLREIKAAPAEDAKRRADESRKRAEAEALAQKKAAAAKLEAAKPVARKAKPASDDVETTASITEQKLPPKSTPMTAKAEPSKVEPPKETASVEPAAGEEASFRWPAKGRVISGFGARGTGGANDGINIALPEGTPVRAAEGGTVVHADDALKGYGKLVLIRHPNGFVSVYAHNGELNVKRGESVKRGQVIAKSGQSGNVTAPQLHFEIRKGSTPVDPTKHLGD